MNYRRTIILFAMVFVMFQIPVSAQDDFFEAETRVGGYGELHYNNNRTKETKTLDFHRFVLFFSHDWSEHWSFNSEVELEHNFVSGGNGELELEQAYVDYHPSDYFGLQAGVVLPSVGIINERHEPPTFLSVERPDYSKNIIPTTWFGNGLAIYGHVKKLSYKLTVMEGLNADGFSLGSGLRGGRQKGYKSNAENLLYNLRVHFLGITGLRLGTSYTINKAFSTQGNQVDFGLWEFHGQYHEHDIYGTFEYGMISYDGGELKTSRGFYADLGYNVASFLDLSTELIPWFRYTDYNPAHETVGGGESEKATHYTKWLVGLTVKPVSSVVFKIDFGTATNKLTDKKTKVLNLGAGYMF